MFDTRHDTIPRGLDEMEPGPILAGFLSSIDVSAVSGYDRIVVMRAERRMASHYNARMYQSMASITDAMSDEFDDDPLDAHSSAAFEIRAALHLTRRATDIELAFALTLRQRLPKVSDMLSSGLIDVRRARTIERETCHLSDAVAQGVADRVAEAAPTMTTGQLAARLRRLCIEVDPGQAEQRYEQSVADRRVVLEPTEMGTANLLGFDLPPDRATFVTRRINKIARSLRGGGETRTMDQLRADVFLDLLLAGGTAEKGAGVVDIRVDLDTLTALAEHPGDVAGYGPVIADIARHVVDGQHDSEWRFTVTDTRDGHLIHTGTTRRRRLEISVDTSRRTIPPVYSPGAGCPAPTVTSIIGSPGPSVESPLSKTSSRSVVTITLADTSSAGRTGFSPTVTVCGPAGSATPTSPAAHRLRRCPWPCARFCSISTPLPCPHDPRPHRIRRRWPARVLGCRSPRSACPGGR